MLRMHVHLSYISSTRHAITITYTYIYIHNNYNIYRQIFNDSITMLRSLNMATRVSKKKLINQSFQSK